MKLELQAKDFVALFLGLSLAVAEGKLFEGHSIGLPCLPGNPCTLAFISDNPVILRCPYEYFGAHISWQYHDPKWADKQPVTFLHAGRASLPLLGHAKLRKLRLKSRLVVGNLYIPSPSVEDSGLYTCRAGDATLAYYLVDFQDAGHIHVSHASLGEATLVNATVQLGKGIQAKLFTSWSPWQACDRCGHSGERKRVGFCYVQLTCKGEQKDPLPCGMVMRYCPHLPQRGPELRVETCHVPCDTSYSLATDESNVAPLLVLTTYHPQLDTTAYLRCPTSSIYSPVYWQEGPTSLTRLELLQKNSSQSLDKATGGGILRLSFQNDSHNATYQCYVNGNLVGKFLVASPSSVPLPKEVAPTYSIIEALIVGLATFLVTLMFLSIIQSCRKKPVTTMV
ncbi:protein FAM187B isoform X2 [Sceloporus undulatus]|uniref:protein FAM187B isoform X2 n=1 Tax=Sceloporus undulatus TaxID=8520 RepID=UPI001C4B9027|nr:protein FAM187B isoform X2 [Sceloporus undulatus]